MVMMHSTVFTCIAFLIAVAPACQSQSLVNVTVQSDNSRNITTSSPSTLPLSSTSTSTTISTLPASTHDSNIVHWTYEDKAGLRIEDWAKQFHACGQKRQSPISINTQTAISDPGLTSLNLIDYDDSPIDNIWTAVNNGHTVQMTGDFLTAPQLQGGGLPGKFIFQQMHFHWGSTRSSGGEHVLDGHRYPFEIHLVHRRKNETEDQAMNDGFGLAVLSIEFNLADENDPPSPELDDIISLVRQAYEPDVVATAALPHFNLLGLCPANKSYVRYLGSLTTPPCSEVVVWTVLTEPLRISERQLNIFRMLHAFKMGESYARLGKLEASNIHLADNFRPVQNLSDRVVTVFHDQFRPVTITTETTTITVAEATETTENSTSESVNTTVGITRLLHLMPVIIEIHNKSAITSTVTPATTPQHGPAVTVKAKTQPVIKSGASSKSLCLSVVKVSLVVCAIMFVNC